MIWSTAGVHPIRVIHKMKLGEVFFPYLKIVLESSNIIVYRRPGRVQAQRYDSGHFLFPNNKG